MRFILPRTTKHCRRVHVRLAYDDAAGRYTDQTIKTALRSLARDWGSINSSETIFNEDGMRLVNFDCSGHGGYLLFTHAPLDGFTADWSSADYHGIMHPFYVYSFEEDCAWALLALSLKPHRLDRMVAKWNAHRIEPSPTLDAARSRLLSLASESVARWSPTFTAKAII